MRNPLVLLSGAIGLGIVGSSICFGGGRAIAQTAAITSVSAQTAQGTYETPVYGIQLGTSQGVNLSFLKTGETIQRVWLNDPSRVVIDFDGCLSNNQADAGSGGCANGTASIIHIRQLSDPIEFPGIAVSGNGRTVFLTVITNASGTSKIYQFQLALGGSTPPYSLVEILPPPPPTRSQIISLTQQYQQRILRQLSQGLAYVEAAGLIDESSPQYSNVRQLIALMQSGTPYIDAMKQTNTSSELVDKLRYYGNENIREPAATTGTRPTATATPRSTPTPSNAPFTPRTPPPDPYERRPASTGTPRTTPATP
jgi:hypothetical protein